MRIKQVEEHLGIDRETVRFYVKEGLLSPHQGSNRYRDYSDEDIRQLKRILIMRDLDMSLSDIRQVLSGEADLAPMLLTSMKALSEKQETVRSAIWTCSELMKSDSASFDPERYFRRREGA